jgi:hypothetical protein
MFNNWIIFGGLLLPILLWIGLALTLRSIKPRTKASPSQVLLFCLFSFPFAPVALALAIAAQRSEHLLLYSSLGMVEGLVIMGLVYLQLRAMSIAAAGGEGK